MNDSFLLAACPACSCPWLRCFPSPFPSGDSFILQVRSCFIFLKLFLGPGWREMHVSIAGFVYLLFTLPGSFCRGICLACSLTSSRSQLQLDLLREAFSDHPVYTNTCTIPSPASFFLEPLILLDSLSLFPSLSLSLSHTHTHTHTHISIFLPTYQLSHCLSSMQILVCHLHESISFMGRVNLMVLITAALQLC